MFDIFSVREEEGSQRVCRRGGVIHAPTGVRGGRATYFLRAYAGDLPFLLPKVAYTVRVYIICIINIILINEFVDLMGYE